MLGSIYALIALGYTMVYGVLRFINFAHGDIYMVGAFIGLYSAQGLHLIQSQGDSMVLSTSALLLILLISMIGSALLGFVIERVAYKPLRRAPRITALITAIGVSMLLEYGGQLVFGTTPRPYPTLAGAAQGMTSSNTSGAVINRVDIVILTVAAALVILLQFIVYRTKVGRAMRALSFDRETASLMGINTDTIITLTFIIGSAFAGAAGVLVGVRNPQIDPLMGLSAGIKAFVAAVIGGIGSIPGAALGGLILGLSEEAVKAVYPPLAEVVVYGVLTLILVLRPSGLLGGTTMEKV